MYLIEWAFQLSKQQMSYEECREDVEKRARKPGQPELNAPYGIGESVSESVYHNESIYAHNDAFIDVRTFNDEKRGVITIFLGWIGIFLFYALAELGNISARRVITGQGPDGQPVLSSDYFFLIFMPLLCVGAIYIYFKYAFPYLRLESFTARRLIVRFNRVTRKVYLLRPDDLGGIRILKWEKAQPVIDKNMTELDGTGGFILLAWDRGDGVDLEGNPTDNIELAFVGKPTRNASELLAFWEYIRRYMEEGPEAAPAPKKLINKFPWPWLSFKVAWRLDTQFLRHSALWVFVLLNILILPAILIHATGHWLSLLLCYEPKFPRAIEEAGAPDKKRAAPR
ncbi:DUF6708 domain-containing protein [Achromobacter sp. MFA1 R4]|uniref:DUF6708 domain-containing protein n=1 Tax=Achromobacter sp. MFA1 R4 TaxID=1881016 RepID=UPI0009538133|nr:DUF6708 domain-containing protein [Achromobacter sp. MFA1 R4]SIT08810.1 hypothetical protein SAMN05428937_0735 [Achromobacter sp. MFA1 R4]